MPSLAVAICIDAPFSQSSSGSSQVSGCVQGRMGILYYRMHSPNSNPRDSLGREVVGKSADSRVYKTAASFFSLAGNQEEGYSMHCLRTQAGASGLGGMNM